MCTTCGNSPCLIVHREIQEKLWQKYSVKLQGGGDTHFTWDSRRLDWEVTTRLPGGGTVSNWLKQDFGINVTKKPW